MQNQKQTSIKFEYLETGLLLPEDAKRVKNPKSPITSVCAPDAEIIHVYKVETTGEFWYKEVVRGNIERILSNVCNF